jgi:5'-phosphate synthase pdxT subunit
MRIGILALQGAVEPHSKKLKFLGAIPVEVRAPSDLEGLAGIILPGGESTTMIHLLKLNALWEPLLGFVHTKPAWGVCAGAILLAKGVHSPSQISLEALNIEVDRNAYGRQRNSFIDRLTPTAEWTDPTPVEGVFIRAPKFSRIFGETRVLLNWKDEPVLVEERNVLASSFHPELTDSTKIHEYFLKKCINAEAKGG